MAGMALRDPLPQALAVSGACFSAFGGLLAGLGALAAGQLLCVWIDIEANTRITARQEWQIDRCVAPRLLGGGPNYQSWLRAGSMHAALSGGLRLGPRRRLFRDLARAGGERRVGVEALA